LLNASQENLGYKVGDFIENKSYIYAWKTQGICLAVSNKKQKQDNQIKLALASKRVCCFTNKFPVYQSAEIQHKLDKISNNFFY